MKGAEMEAHAANIGIAIDTGVRPRPRRRRLAELMSAFRGRSARQAERAYRAQANRAEIASLQGSEHTHLLRRPRGF
jgi:hypothetical protein